MGLYSGTDQAHSRQESVGLTKGSHEQLEHPPWVGADNRETEGHNLGLIQGHINQLIGVDHDTTSNL